jgi:hypothetical protein
LQARLLLCAPIHLLVYEEAGGKRDEGGGREVGGRRRGREERES